MDQATLDQILFGKFLRFNYKVIADEYRGHRKVLNDLLDGQHVLATQLNKAVDGRSKGIKLDLLFRLMALADHHKVKPFIRVVTSPVWETFREQSNGVWFL